METPRWWRGAILLGATSGLRLGDIANLQWGSVTETDPETGCFEGVFASRPKRRARLFCADAFNFAEWLLARPERGIGRAQVFLRLRRLPQAEVKA